MAKIKVFDDGEWRPARRSDLHTDRALSMRGVFLAVGVPSRGTVWVQTPEGFFSEHELVAKGWLEEDGEQSALFPEPPHPDTMMDPPF